MVKKIELYEKELDSVFKEQWEMLEKADYISHSEIESLPKYGGIYVFYENKIPIYVGRTKNIRQRIQLHTRESSKKDSATFAFNLAKMKYKSKFPDKKIKTRNLLMNDKEFIPLFKLEKDRVKKMQIKFINEENDILQTMLEPYLAHKLNTHPEYNTFETH